MKYLTLDQQVLDNLNSVLAQLKGGRQIPKTLYFPFLICFQYIDKHGVIKGKIEKLRLNLCSDFYAYISESDFGSYEKVSEGLKLLVNAIQEHLDSLAMADENK